MSRKYKTEDIDGEPSVVDEGGDVVGSFLYYEDATLFAHAEAVLEAARSAYMLLVMPIIDTPNREEMHDRVATNLKLAIARAEGKMP